jgi:hypothetical protein
MENPPFVSLDILGPRQSGVQFGAAVASLGDINKDGYNGTSFSYCLPLSFRQYFFFYFLVTDPKHGTNKTLVLILLQRGKKGIRSIKFGL